MKWFGSLSVRLRSKAQDLVRDHRRMSLVAWLGRHNQFVNKARDTVGYNMVTNGEAKFLQRLGRLMPCACIIDVGANRGDWTAIALETFPTSQFHLFEIAAPIHAKCAARYAGNPRVVVNPFGLSDRDEPVDVFYYEPADFLTSALGPRGSSSVVLQGQVVKGDQYLAARRIAAVDLLKIDVEGMEFRVLKGLQGAIGGGNIGVIQFEAHEPKELRAISALLEPSGYTVGRLFTAYWEPYSQEPTGPIGPNHVAIHRSRAHLEAVLRKGF